MTAQMHYCPRCRRNTWWNPTQGEYACSICGYWHPDNPIYVK